MGDSQRKVSKFLRQIGLSLLIIENVTATEGFLKVA